MSPERVAIYLQDLAGLSERQIHYAFGKARVESKFIPKVPELLEWAQDGAEMLQKQDAEERTRLLLTRGDKPDEWNPRLDDVWAELDSRAEAQERLDIAFCVDYSDEEIQAIVKSGDPPKATGGYIAWVRRLEARNRLRSGAKIPSMRQYGPMFERIASAEREAGAGPEEDL